MEGKSAVYVLCIFHHNLGSLRCKLILTKKVQNKQTNKHPRVIKVIKHMTFQQPAKDIKFSLP